MTDKTPALSFQYFEVRPVIQDDDGCTSFTDEEAFAAERDRRAADANIETFWTVYGIDQEGHAHAVADMGEKTAALQTMRAILAPFAAALDILNAGDRTTDVATLRDRIARASALIEDFIIQCSNEDRI